MYRELSLDYFETEENLKTRGFSGRFCSYKERPFSAVPKKIYGRLLFMERIIYGGIYIFGKCRSYLI